MYSNILGVVRFLNFFEYEAVILHTHEVRFVCGTDTGLVIGRCRQVADVSEVTPLQWHTVCSHFYITGCTLILYVCVNNIHQEYKPLYEMSEIYILFFNGFNQNVRAPTVFA